MECGCLQVINLISEKKWDGNYLGMMVRVDKLACHLDPFKFVHMFKDANIAAHIMARHNLLDYYIRVWVGSCPCVLEYEITLNFC